MNRKELDPDSSPEAAFGARLRTSREERGWKQEELAERMGYSGTHISAVETGRKRPTLPLARRADVALSTGEEFERAWRKLQHSGLLEGFPQFVEYEAQAAEIRLYEVGVIPGLVQTPEYATALLESVVKRGAITEEQAAERITLIEERQATLARTPAPLVFVMMDESCLLRPVGERGVMEAQLERLIEFSELPNTVLQVAPFAMGARRPLSLPLYLLTLPDRSLVSYAESAHQGHLERDITFVLPLLTSYHQLQAQAPSQAESVAMIKQLRKGSP
ncbi:helix-turn-helix domain-containing protein [Streptomyces catenulae]|uniref:Helix-turn-helix transcriptional regulator n=1 Tax=Streptomyces catenulae TaxID=66875 RepID=A0ABV2Z923_9ACTN|nr:helix-turn-helix transcriptional regulator [Streptomyces catenulae]